MNMGADGFSKMNKPPNSRLGGSFRVENSVLKIACAAWYNTHWWARYAKKIKL